jgi:HlyD family secretion protein
MEKILIFIKSLTKRQLILGAVGIAALGGLVYGFTRDSVVTIVKAERGDIEEEVLVTGKTKSAEEVDLGFEQGGKVVRVSGKIGTQVFKGNTLVVLDQSSELADLRKAQANLNEELVKLDSTKQSTNLEYEDAYSKAINELKDSYTSADNAVRNIADKFFESPRSSAVKFNITFEDGATTYYFNIRSADKEKLQDERRQMEKELDDWKASLDKLTPGVDLKESFVDAENKLNDTRDFLSLLASAINSLTTDDFAHQTTIQGYKTSVSNARTEVSSALTNLLSARQTLNNAPSATGSLLNKDFNDVRAGEARVESLRANVASIQAELGKLVLRSPISGVITKSNAHVGEIVTSGESLISVISDNDLEIEANVSEVNIGKVKVGNTVLITFDAFPNITYKGNVIYIDPGETVIDGVPSYKVTVAFTDEISNDVRSGLTANLRIETSKKENVIKIPRYAVQKRSERSYIVIKAGNREEEREIVTGLIGKDGTIEVISGVNEGEEIIAEIKS